MFKFKPMPLALLGALFTVSSAAQAYMIDDFTGDLGSFQIGTINHTTGTESYSEEALTTGGSTIGNFRDVYLHNPSTPSDMTSQVIVGGGGAGSPDYNLYISNDVSNPSTTTATATFIWDGGPDDPTTVNVSGLGSIDITDGGSAQGFFLDAFYLSAGVKMTMTVWANDGLGGYVSDTAFITSLAGEDLFLSFTSFTGLSLTDFTRISALRMDIDGNDEYEVQAISLQTTASAVPEPSTLALAGIGLLGLARRRAIR